MYYAQNTRMLYDRSTCIMPYCTQPIFREIKEGSRGGGPQGKEADWAGSKPQWGHPPNKHVAICDSIWKLRDDVLGRHLGPE